MHELERPDGRMERRDGPRATNEALTALGRLLDSVRREAEIDAIAIADPSGVLVAGAGLWTECEELAAVAPLSLRASPAANDTVPTRLDVLARRMEVRRLMVDGVEVLVCGPGGATDALARAAAGCARILGRRRR